MHDARVAGVVALAPCACFFADSFFATRATPLLVMAGTEDHFVPITNNGQRAYMLAGPPKDLVALVGGTHLYFTDLRIADDTLMPTPTTGEDVIAMALARYNGGTACDTPPSFPGDPAMSFDAQHRHTIEWVTAFADATLRNRPDAIMALRARGESDLHVQHAP
jgi:predicted dienelactone hydrolase